jgi:hypothetical protein
MRDLVRAAVRQLTTVGAPLHLSVQHAALRPHRRSVTIVHRSYGLVHVVDPEHGTARHTRSTSIAA